MAIKISIEHQSTLFKAHFEEKNNDRIIFSGAFGIGKTYFLEQFFAPANADYLAVKLAPVNYSVSANEDIFKLIKYDILFELLLRHDLKLDTKPELISREVAYGVMLPSKVQSIAEGLLKALPLLNKAADEIPTALEALQGWFTTIQDIEQARAVPGPDKPAEAHLEEMSKHFTLEVDYITEFLEESLNKLATAKKAKSKVLIIDDLDRIDPEHIFRLFNIFSAHLDYHKTNRNKFGFDKVVFVCDIQNVRNIFHSRYGADTDFNGYIDKFFSREVYHFSNEKELGNYAEQLINSFQFEDTPRRYFQQHLLQGRNSREKGLLYIILKELLLSGALKMRRLAESYQLYVPLPSKEIDVSAPERGIENVHYRQLPALVALEILSKIMGGGLALSRAIKTVRRYQRSLDYQSLISTGSRWLTGMVLPLLDFTQHQFQATGLHGYEPLPYIYTYESGGHFDYTLALSREEEIYSGIIANSGTIEFFYLLDLTVENLLQTGVLK
jgi:hypothetical protein